jgi:hypothetical protein
MELTIQADNAERLENIFTWEDQYRTWLLVVVLVIAGSIVWVIGARYIVLIILADEFHGGVRKYKKYYERNKKLIRWSLEQEFKRLGERKKKFYEDYKNSLKVNQWISKKSLRKIERLVIENIRKRHKLIIPKHFRLSAFKSPL